MTTVCLDERIRLVALVGAPKRNLAARDGLA
jgi:hypothetical protein